MIRTVPIKLIEIFTLKPLKSRSILAYQIDLSFIDTSKAVTIMLCSFFEARIFQLWQIFYTNATYTSKRKICNYENVY